MPQVSKERWHSLRTLSKSGPTISHFSEGFIRYLLSFIDVLCSMAETKAANGSCNRLSKQTMGLPLYHRSQLYRNVSHNVLIRGCRPEFTKSHSKFTRV